MGCCLAGGGGNGDSADAVAGDGGGGDGDGAGFRLNTEVVEFHPLKLPSAENLYSSMIFIPSSPAGGSAQRLDVGRRPNLCSS